MHLKSQQVKKLTAFLGSLLFVSAVIGASIAFASLTFTGTNITGDSNEVIDATGTISIGSSNAMGMRIGNTSATVSIFGNVGLGLASPFSPLQVAGLPAQSTTSSLVLLGSNLISGGNSSGTLLAANPASAFNGDFMNFQVGSSTTFLVNSSGSLTIGTGTPVNGAILTTAAPQFNGLSQNILTVLANGNVGIGTSTPNAGLEICRNCGGAYGSGAALRLSRSDNFINSFEFLLSASNEPYNSALYIQPSVQSGDIIFRTFASNVTLDLTDGGNVGIGTNNPSSTLQVVGASSTVTIGTASLPGCLEMGSASGTAKIIYVTFDANAVMTATTTKPNACK
jgi:hypothetical protein